MNFKNISIIFSFLFIKSIVLSSPIEEEKPTSNEDDLDIVNLDLYNTDDTYNYTVEDTSDSDEEETSIIENFETTFGVEDEITGSIENEDECLTPECYEVSKRVLSNIDLSVNPCDDFYKFACGGYE
eukprot:jgi/Orpsp1_1/1191596/evm.model.d7180000087215.1